MDDNSKKTFGQILTELYHRKAMRMHSDYSRTTWSREEYGISNQAMSNYMNDVRQPSGENLERIIDVHGPVVYEWMGKPVPKDYDPIRRMAYRQWRKLSEETRKKIAELVERELAKKKGNASA